MRQFPSDPFTLVVGAIIVVLAFIPLWKILTRMGYSGGWAFVGVI